MAPHDRKSHERDRKSGNRPFDLREWAKDRLERFKTPDIFHFVDALPAGRTVSLNRPRVLGASSLAAPETNKA